VSIRAVAIVLCLVGPVGPASAADDVLDAIDAALKAYQAGDLTGSKQQLDLAAVLVGRKNAEAFAAVLPQPLPGWKAERAQTSMVGAMGFGASQASRNYINGKGDNVEVQVTGDSSVIAQVATFLANPAIAGALGKIGRVGSLRAIVSAEGDLHIVVANKFLVLVQGRASAADKMSFAQAIDVARLGKM
jgi:hypothetical protein